MMVANCRYCDSTEDVVQNKTNSRHKYFCEDCDQPFNPERWECPGCEQDVGANPLDQFFQYYCNECNMAFNRLGYNFDPDTIEKEILNQGFDTPEKELTLHVEETPESLPDTYYQFTLKNTGQELVKIQGRNAFAFQYRVTDDIWWTIYGNPEHYSPKEEIVLDPGETIEWEIQFSWKRFRIPDVNLRYTFRNGEYRLVYWGIPATESALTTSVEVELHGSDDPDA